MTEEEVDNGKGVTEEVWVELQNDLFSNSNFFQLNKRLRPLNDVVPNSNFFDPYLWVFVMGRCSSLQMVNLRFDDPNPDQRFEDMRFFMEKNGDFIDQVSPIKTNFPKKLFINNIESNILFIIGFYLVIIFIPISIIKIFQFIYNKIKLII